MTRRSLALAVAVSALALLAGACSDGDSASESTTTSSSSTTSATATPPDTTSVTIGIICSTPAEAAQGTVDSWIAGDEAAARRCANDSVVNTLFENNGADAGWTFEGCDTETDPGVPSCFYRYEGGGVTLTIEGTEAAGWKATNISFVAD